VILVDGSVRECLPKQVTFGGRPKAPLSWCDSDYSMQVEFKCGCSGGSFDVTESAMSFAFFKHYSGCIWSELQEGR
jgi:hypothetical protein